MQMSAGQEPPHVNSRIRADAFKPMPPSHADRGQDVRVSQSMTENLETEATSQGRT